MYIEFKFDKCKQTYVNAYSNASYKFKSLLPLLVPLLLSPLSSLLHLNI